MAIRLDMQATVNMREERIAEDRRKAFRIIKISLAALIGGITAAAVISGMATTAKINTVAAEYQTLSASFEAMKKTAAETEAYVKDQQAQQSDPEKIDREMYSASKDGARVCELLDMAYKGELVRDEYKNELYTLTHDWDGTWFGAELDPKASPIKWDFLTWYDSTEREYNVLWGCYAPDQDGNPKYLLCMRFGTYNGESHNFNLGNTYYTTFGNMYEMTGKIEDDGSGSNAGDIISAADQLAGDDTSGTSSSTTSDTTGTQAGLPGGLAPGADAHGGNDAATRPDNTSGTTSLPTNTDNNNTSSSSSAADDVPVIRV